MKKLFLILFVFSFVSFLSAQEKILLEIDDEKITADEFLHIYKKNNTDANAMSYNAMNEYMELFTNFKLKVHEAELLGLDTVQSFVRELGGYRSQLAQPYLNDKKVEEDIIKEAYDRMLYDVKVSHILIKLSPNAEPEDTLKAYKRINDIYKSLQNGADFTETAKSSSEEDGAHAHGGDLGYRTVFGLVYEFETIMYETPVGSYSKPFRSSSGYHILKVTDKRPAKGKYKVAHIMKVVPADVSQASKKQARDDVYEMHSKLVNGEDFAKMAEEKSDDRRTAEKEGEIGWISVGGRMIREFENAVFSLENIGDISPVLETSYGYHIIKLLDIDPIKPFDEIKNNIKSQISNTARTSKSKDVVLDRLKKEYNLNINNENLKEFNKYVTDSIFTGTWVIDNNADLSKVLFTFSDMTYTQKDFADFLAKFNRKQQAMKIPIFVNNMFDTYVENMLIKYEESVLENKYPEFKYLIKEYHDGILLFELTDKMVWTKAVKDTVGLQKFYNENMYKYMWSYRYDVKEYQCKDSKIAKSLEKALKKEQNDEKILSKLNKKDSTNVMVVENVIGEKNSSALIDNLIKENNIPEKDQHVEVINNTTDNTVTIIRVLAPAPKTLDDARGIITADYQNYLEKEWIKELRKKYKIVVHDDVLRSIAE